MWPSNTFFHSKCNSSAWCKGQLHFISTLLPFLFSSVFGTEGLYAPWACIFNVRAPFNRLTAKILCENSNYLCCCYDIPLVIMRTEIYHVVQKPLGALKHGSFFTISRISGVLVFRYSKCRLCNRYSMSTQPRFSMWREVTQSTLMELCKLANDWHLNVHWNVKSNIYFQLGSTD